jgi:hypothetical protein
MSGLERRIAEWRRLMSDQTTGEKAAVELEDHLREEIAGLQEKGLSGEEAFVVASLRLGNPAVLQEEFAKVDPGALWGRRLRRVMFVVLGYLLGIELFAFVAKGFALLSLQCGLSGYGAMIPGVLIAAALFGWLAFIVIRRTDGGSMETVFAACRKSGRRRVAAAALVLTAVVLPFLLNFLMNVLLVRIVSPNFLGEIAYAMSLASSSFHLMLPVGLAIWILRKPEEPVLPETTS